MKKFSLIAITLGTLFAAAYLFFPEKIQHRLESVRGFNKLKTVDSDVTDLVPHGVSTAPSTPAPQKATATATPTKTAAVQRDNKVPANASPTPSTASKPWGQTGLDTANGLDTSKLEFRRRK